MFRARELLIRQRTQTINALRGHLAEFGLVVPQGPANLSRLIALVEDPGSNLPAPARTTLLSRMLERKPPMLVRVVLANKMARIVWALMARGEVYRAPTAAA